MTTDRLDQFKQNLENWFRVRCLSKSIQLVKMPSGQSFCIGRFQSDEPFPSTWKFLFDTSFSILRIVDTTGGASLIYNFVGHTSRSSRDAFSAIFIAEANYFCYRFNEEKKFVHEAVFRQLFLNFDENGAIQLTVGLTNAPRRRPYYFYLRATLPLKYVGRNYTTELSAAFEEMPPFLDHPEECIDDTDIANRDLDERKILLHFEEAFI